MKIMQYLLDNMKANIINATISREPDSIPNNIVILDKNDVILLRSGTIYLGDFRDIIMATSKGAIPRNVIFFASFNPDSKKHVKLKTNIIETNLSLIKLYNKVNALLTSARSLVKYGASESTFDSFFESIISMKIATGDEIRSAFYGLNIDATDPYNIIVIDALDVNTIKSNYNNLEKELLNLFPTSNHTLYHNKIVLMYHHPGRQIHLPEEQIAPLKRIMTKYDTFAGISNHTKRINMIRTDYIITQRILDICSTMFDIKKHRVFTQEEHGLFYIVDLCCKQFEYVHDHNNMIYLCHPGIVALINYDNIHNTNMRKILMNYLLNDRNLSKTAQLMHMHRNTMMNKIKKISEIVCDDIDDPLIRQRLLFSCLICDYSEKFNKVELRPIQGNDDL